MIETIKSYAKQLWKIGRVIVYVGECLRNIPDFSEDEEGEQPNGK
jgi:hypothetical protein